MISLFCHDLHISITKKIIWLQPFMSNITRHSCNYINQQKIKILNNRNYSIKKKNHKHHLKGPSSFIEEAFTLLYHHYVGNTSSVQNVPARCFHHHARCSPQCLRRGLLLRRPLSDYWRHYRLYGVCCGSQDHFLSSCWS